MISSSSHRWLITVSVLTGTIMAVLDASIVNVALPDMSGSLGASTTEITWVIAGYMLANVVIMPIIALLSERFGRKNFYIANIVLFTVASMLCGMARSLPLMIVFRIFQGIGGGVLMTVSQAILRETFPPEEQGLAMGIYGMGVVVAPAIGPTLGGWLTDTYSWPWIFFINVPIGILCVILVGRFVQDPPYLVRGRGAIDWPGLAFMTVGLGSLQLVLEQGAEKDWFESPWIAGLAIAAAVGLVLFVWRELRTERPAVDLRLLKNVPFSSATFLGGVLGMGLYGSLFILPLFLQRLLGYSAMESGLALAPRSITMAVVMPLSGFLYNRVGPRVLVAMGLAVSAFSFYQFTHLSLDTSAAAIVVPQIWQGVGFGLIFVALSTAALTNIPRARVTAGAGLYNVVRQVFGSVGIAVAATQISTGTSRYHDTLAAQVNPYSEATRQWLADATAGFMQSSVDSLEAARRALSMLDQTVLAQATVMAYNHVFLLVALSFAVAIPLAFFLRGHRGEMPAEAAAVEA
ncbi:MAG TPA: DHA2 family efflux MFS transporter permease subunit [Candidatus Eisenbacteria bacterium]|nr:DHA2 family efflux MFS transporter permease subunit [Candidatus Eisenbacteria bacterium]